MAIVDKKFSLYPLVESWGVRQVYTYYRGALQALSYGMEQAIVDAKCHGTLYAGFQKFSFFMHRERIYRQLAAQVDHIWVFGIPDVSPPPIPNIHYVSLEEDHQLVREWFLLMDAPSLFTSLVAEELTDFNTPNSERRFRGVWTFDDVLVSYLQTRLGNQLAIRSQHRSQKNVDDYSDQLTAVGLITQELVQSLENSNEKLREAERIQKEFTQMLVHDMRSPLTAIILKLSTLLQNSNSQLHPDNLAQVYTDLLRLSKSLSLMIDDMLSISLAEDGTLTLTKTAVSPKDLVDSATSQVRSRAEEKGVRLTVDCADEMTAVLADFDKIRRVLSNLLNNAIKFTDEDGHVSIIVKLMDNFVQFSVHDNGCGIELEPVEQVFEKYTTSKSIQSKGTGLGLAYCKLMVEKHGGTIEVESEVDVGTTFHVLLPGTL